MEVGRGRLRTRGYTNTIFRMDWGFPVMGAIWAAEIADRYFEAATAGGVPGLERTADRAAFGA